MMQRLFIEQPLATAIRKLPKGSVLFVDDFLHMGNRENIKKALLRLKEKGLIIRLAHVIYAYPKNSRPLGAIIPSAEDVAQAIARRDMARIVPSGALALNQLGLSTQVPLRAVYLTDGAARVVKIGRRTINFKKTTPKNLQAKGRLSGMAIQALKMLGQKNTDDILTAKLSSVLRNENKTHLLHDAQLAPEWIRKIMLNTIP
jgi:hypothetical protein